METPLAVIGGHKKAVSYVRFLGGDRLVSASTDNKLKLWDIKEATSSQGCSEPLMTFSGDPRLWTSPSRLALMSCRRLAQAISWTLYLAVYTFEFGSPISSPNSVFLCFKNYHTLDGLHWDLSMDPLLPAFIPHDLVQLGWTASQVVLRYLWTDIVHLLVPYVRGIWKCVTSGYTP